MLGKYRVGVIPAQFLETSKLPDNNSVINAILEGRTNNITSCAINTIMEEKRDRSMCEVTET